MIDFVEKVPIGEVTGSCLLYTSAFLKAQETGKPVELCCAIGDDEIDGKPYHEIVEIARKFIKDAGGFEAFAEWGLF